MTTPMYQRDKIRHQKQPREFDNSSDISDRTVVRGQKKWIDHKTVGRQENNYSLS